MSYYCKCPVALPHGAVGGLQFVIVVFLDHTHLLSFAQPDQLLCYSLYGTIVVKLAPCKILIF